MMLRRAAAALAVSFATAALAAPAPPAPPSLPPAAPSCAEAEEADGTCALQSHSQVKTLGGAASSNTGAAWALLSGGASRAGAVTTHAQVRSAVQQLYTSHVVPFAAAKAALAKAKSRMLEKQGGGSEMLEGQEQQGGSQSLALGTVGSEMLEGLGDSDDLLPIDLGDSDDDDLGDLGDSDDLGDDRSDLRKCLPSLEGLEGVCGLHEDNPTEKMCSEPCKKALVAVKRDCSPKLLKMAHIDQLSGMCKGCTHSLVDAAGQKTCDFESFDDDTLDMCSAACRKPVCGILDACDPDSTVDLPGLGKEDLSKALKKLTKGTQTCGC